MKRYEAGQAVRIDIPDESDPDHERLHGQRGRIVEILEDDASELLNDEREQYLFRVRVDESGEEVDVRWRDLRPA